MSMQMHQRIGAAFFLDAFNQVIRRLRLEQARHILDADGVGAHLLEPLRHLDECADGVKRADRIADGALCVFAGLLHGSHAGVEIAQIIQRIEDPEDVHAVLGGLVDEALDYAIFIMPIAEEILPTKQHL